MKLCDGNQWWLEGHPLNEDMWSRFLEECRQAIGRYSKSHLFSSILYRLYSIWPEARVVAAAWTCDGSEHRWLSSTLIDTACPLDYKDHNRHNLLKTLRNLYGFARTWQPEGEPVGSDKPRCCLLQVNCPLIEGNPLPDDVHCCPSDKGNLSVRVFRPSPEWLPANRNDESTDYRRFRKSMKAANIAAVYHSAEDFALLRVPVEVNPHKAEHLRVFIDVFMIRMSNGCLNLGDVGRDAKRMHDEISTLMDSLLVGSQPKDGPDIRLRLTSPRLWSSETDGLENRDHSDSVCRLAIPKWPDFRYQYAFSKKQREHLKAMKISDVEEGSDLLKWLDEPVGEGVAPLFALGSPDFPLVADELDRQITRILPFLRGQDSKSEEWLRSVFFLLCAPPKEGAGYHHDLASKLRNLGLSSKPGERLRVLLENVAISQGAVVRSATAGVADFQIRAAKDPDYEKATFADDPARNVSPEVEVGTVPYSPIVQAAEHWALKPLFEGKNFPGSVLTFPLFLPDSPRPFGVISLLLDEKQELLPNQDIIARGSTSRRCYLSEINNRVLSKLIDAQPALASAYLDDLADRFYEQAWELFIQKGTGLAETREVASWMSLWMAWFSSLPSISFLVKDEGGAFQPLQDPPNEDVPEAVISIYDLAKEQSEAFIETDKSKGNTPRDYIALPGSKDALIFSSQDLRGSDWLLYGLQEAGNLHAAQNASFQFVDRFLNNLRDAWNAAKAEESARLSEMAEQNRLRSALAAGLYHQLAQQLAALDAFLALGSTHLDRVKEQATAMRQARRLAFAALTGNRRDFESASLKTILMEAAETAVSMLGDFEEDPRAQLTLAGLLLRIRPYAADEQLLSDLRIEAKNFVAKVAALDRAESTCAADYIAKCFDFVDVDCSMEDFEDVDVEWPVYRTVLQEVLTNALRGLALAAPESEAKPELRIRFVSGDHCAQLEVSNHVPADTDPSQIPDPSKTPTGQSGWGLHGTWALFRQLYGRDFPQAKQESCGVYSYHIQIIPVCQCPRG